MAFFDSFFGKDQRKDIKRASASAQEKYKTGLGQFTDTTENFLDKSLGFFEPYSGAGLGAQNLYSDYLGVNGPESRQGFFDDFQFGPEFEAGTNYGIRALDRSAAARGGLYSGNHAEDLYDFGLQRFGQFINPYVDRLERAAGQGLNIAGAQSGMTSQAGQNIADAQFGTQQLMANNDINTGNAVADTRSIGINNLLGLGQLAVSAFTGMPMGGFGGGQQPSFVGQSQAPLTPFPWQRA